LGKRGASRIDWRALARGVVGGKKGGSELPHSKSLALRRR
jgi:hypothetical protein